MQLPLLAFVERDRDSRSWALLSVTSPENSKNTKNMTAESGLGMK